MRKASATAYERLHMIELLAPLYDAIPHPDSDDDVTVYAVTLRRNADERLEIMFPELSRPGKMLAMDVACVNQHAGGCRCDFVRLLRSVLTLSEKHVLRVTAKYEISSVETAVAEGHEEEGGRARKTATLQLFLALHERVTKASAANLGEFDLVMSHLQSGLRSFKAKHDGDRLAEAVQTAKQSKCHVVGCELHPLEGDGTLQPDARFTLDEVFQRLTTQVEVDQMAVRDDETYVARMKRAKRKVLLTDLPIPALHTFIRMLGARELAAVSAVCTTFQHLAYEVVPGLKLLLYSHQRRGLRWLLYREGSTREELKRMPHPFVFPSISLASDANPRHSDENESVLRLRHQEFDPEFIDLIDGRLVKQWSVSRAVDFRGGLFCDEPGLGKTITMLALLLRTKGQISDARNFRASSTSLVEATSVSLRSAGRRGRAVHPNLVTRSAATLIVVPMVLIEHWHYQIEVHVAKGTLKVYLDDAECKRVLPSPQELAEYDVVITSFGRLTQEWKHRRPTSALEENIPARYGYEDAPRRFVDGSINHGTSPLLMVHWVRLIVDEGHNLGGTYLRDHMEMAAHFHADIRWIMTGTPTPNKLKSSNVGHIHGLLVFLRDHPFGDLDKRAWNKVIMKPFERNERAGYVRLLHLLNRIMLRHTKESVQTFIPAPIRHRVLVSPTPMEYAAYNGIVGAARSNLVITNIDEETPREKHPDSLLNPRHYPAALEVMANLRMAACGGCKVRAVIDPFSCEETLDLLRTRHCVDPYRVLEVERFMQRAESVDKLSMCTLCSRQLQLLMLIPCGHMTCADCVEDRVKNVGFSCGVCDATFDWNDFQRLQPGAKVKQYNENWQGHDAAPNLRVDRADNTFGRFQERSDRNLVLVREVVGDWWYILDATETARVQSSKLFYVGGRIKELRREFEQANIAARQDPTLRGLSAHRPKVVKAVIFSQFPEHMRRTKISLAQQEIFFAEFSTHKYMSGESVEAARIQNLIKFRQDPKCNVLLLSDLGILGLDLSFVTHIFLMDEIWDKSVENQVISRAHRMGAQQSVVVEQLLMHGSVEEQLNDMNRHRSHGGDTQTQDNSLMSHNQIGEILDGLRLMEGKYVAEEGFVKVKVIDDQGQFVREENRRLSSPDQESDSVLPERVTQERHSAPEAPSPQQTLPATTHSDAKRATPSTIQGPSPAAASLAASHSVKAGKETHKRKRVTFEQPSPAQNHAESRKSDHGIIDLTSDGDSADEHAEAHSRVRIVEGVDDSETDEDWDPLTSRVSPAKAKKKGKTKRIRIVYDDDDDDESEDDWHSPVDLYRVRRW